MTDNKKILKVLNGFTELSQDEKQIFVKEISDYLNQNDFAKNETSRQIRVKLQSHLGPTSDRNCPCCGKS